MLELCLMIVDSQEDKVLFEDLYNEYHNLVFFISNSFLRNQSLAEEATQEAFFYIAKNFESFKKENINLKAYVSSVARGFAISCYRKERHHLENEEYNEVELQHVPVDDSEFDIYDVIALQKAIKKLPEASANMLELAYVYGLPSAKIGEIYKLSASTARKRIERAKKLLISIMNSEVE